MPKKIFEIKDFTAGLNAYSDPRDIGENEFAQSWNANTSKKGVVKKLANMGRVVSENQKPVPDEVAKFIMDGFDKDVKGAFKKIRKAIKRKKININIGR